MKLNRKRIQEYERKYGVCFAFFDRKIRSEEVTFEEEDDWIDWGDTIEFMEKL